MQTKFLDRGDSTYVHFDEVTNLCKIYKDRPFICRVEDYHQTYLTNQYS
ncbi:YkgJ family cysteine cluster protein [Gilliamella apicola]|nr:YkgJ family cysteine cluster protein [Gilliamella apicola]